MKGKPLGALLLLGLVTWRRMLRRNLVTDEYKRGMEITRSAFEEADPSLRRYRPFKKLLLFDLDSEAFVSELPKQSNTLDDTHEEKRATPLRLRIVRAYFPTSRFNRPKPIGKDDKLRRAFKLHGDIDLGGAATISTKEEGTKWLVRYEDEHKSYRFRKRRKTCIIRKTKDNLAVYEPRKPTWGGLVEIVGVMNSIFVAALLFLLVLVLAEPPAGGATALSLKDPLSWAALGIGIAGMLASCVIQFLLMKNQYEQYDIRVPKGDSPSHDNNIPSTTGK